MNTTANAMTLQDFNNEHVRKLLAPIIYLVILLIIGVPGNFTVLIIYGRKYDKCVYRSIIWNLAIADLTFCTVGIPFNIARVVHYYTFRGLWVCKIFTSLLIFGIMYSTHLLMLLSLHRFRQICMPLKDQITVWNVKYFIVACFIIGLVLTWPQVTLEELEHVTLEYNLTGQICPITSSNPSVYWIANSIVLLCLFVFYTAVLFVIYSLIGRKIYLQRQRRSRQDASEMSAQNFSSKMTKIAFTISVVFAISYIPLFFLKVTKELINEDNLSAFGFSMLRLAERLYIVNHVANPFIYAFFDNRFRQQFKLLASFKWSFRREQSYGQSSGTSTTSVTN